ncbi:unnamed protein product [Spodoptera littoralis]|uniref:Uncharacterized protein n=1 Tax=Spodoptera littoralis TaxID=7109 RepID=A0A9P0IIB0_SPOLI|nr:unnamed protein product [Spodoptera littoralis]CAH1647375.1 unnamed protein product [Spodoptera littoralis]
MESPTDDSFDPVLFAQSESSLSLTSNSEENIKVISYLDSNYQITSSKHYLYCYVPDRYSSIQTEQSTYISDDSSGEELVIRNSNRSVSVESDASHYTDLEDSHGTIHGHRYIVYRLSQQNQTDMYSTEIERLRNKEPVIVIDNLNGTHDIQTMVNQILAKNEFSKVSSLYVVVPTSDEDVSKPVKAPPRSTICVQLSEHHNWNENDETDEIELVSPHTRGLKISTKGKKFCLEGLQETLSSLSEEESTSKVKRPNFLKRFHRHLKKEKMEKSESTEEKEVIVNREKATKNKLCQITTPKEMFRRFPRSMSTDIHQLYSDYTNDKLNESSNVVSELITPLLVNQGLKCDTHRSRPMMISVTQQASIMSMTRGCSVAPCQLSTVGRGRRNAVQLDECPIQANCPEEDTDKPPDLPDNCRCCPEKLKQMLQQALEDKAQNLRSTACGGVPEDTEDDCGYSKQECDEDSSAGCTCSGTNKRMSCPCQLFPLPISKTTNGPKEGTRSLSCQCCNCEESKLKFCPGTKNLGSCTMEVIGPAGGISLIEPNGTYTQAGMIQTQVATSTEPPRKECVCDEKKTNSRLNFMGGFLKSKRATKQVCECCPVPEPEPEPEPQIVLKRKPDYDIVISPTPGIVIVPEPEPPDEDQLRRNAEMIEERRRLKEKSDSTHAISGFRLFKGKAPPPTTGPPEVELTMEEAVRYYATLNPEIIQEFIPPPIVIEEKPFKECTCEEKKLEKKLKKKRKKTKIVKEPIVICECPVDPEPPPPPPEQDPLIIVVPDSMLKADETPDGEGDEPQTETVPEPPLEGPTGGIKLAMTGKGSGSKGLSNLYCFEKDEDELYRK